MLSLSSEVGFDGMMPVRSMVPVVGENPSICTGCTGSVAETVMVAGVAITSECFLRSWSGHHFRHPDTCVAIVRRGLIRR